MGKSRVRADTGTSLCTGMRATQRRTETPRQQQPPLGNLTAEEAETQEPFATDSGKSCSPQQIAAVSPSEPAPRPNYKALIPALPKSTWTFPAETVQEEPLRDKGRQATRSH